MGRLELESSLEHEFVRVAPGPLLALFNRSHDGVLGRAPMGGRMTHRAVIAAANVSTGQALTQIDPSGALLG
jgi:hypothetical protein